MPKAHLRQSTVAWSRGEHSQSALFGLAEDITTQPVTLHKIGLHPAHPLGSRQQFYGPTLRHHHLLHGQPTLLEARQFVILAVPGNRTWLLLIHALASLLL